jgi:hypothetical protein
MQPITFTASERKAISAAFDAIHYLSETTNWTDASAFRAAYKACRKDNTDTQTEAQARVSKAWLEGARAIDCDAPLSNYPWGYTEYYQRAFRLGCEQALKHSGPNRSDYTGPLYDKARQLAASAMPHWQAALERWHAIPMAERAGLTE